MAKQHGRFQTFSWNSNVVNGITDGSIDISRAKIKVTTHDSGDAETYLQGRLEGTVSINGKWDEADAGQSGLFDDLIAGTQRTVYFRMNTGAGLHSFTGTAQCDKFNGKGPNDDAADFSADLTFSGAVVAGVQ